METFMQALKLVQATQDRMILRMIDTETELREHIDMKVDELRHEMLDQFDGVYTILLRLDEERAFTRETLRRIEERMGRLHR